MAFLWFSYGFPMVSPEKITQRPGITAVPFGSEASMTFAGDEAGTHQTAPPRVRRGEGWGSKFNRRNKCCVYNVYKYD